jgi:putative transposase
MSRIPRHQQIVPGFPHHLILRGNNRRNLVSGVADRLLLLRLMLTARCRDACAVWAAAVMTNHMHAVVVPRSAFDLSAWVQSFAQSFAQRRNAARGASGKLFEQRFEAPVIETDRQLAATLAYVDLNPIRAGVQPTWSTLALHAGGRVQSALAELWTPSPWWTSLGPDDESRREAYRDFAIARAETWAPDVVRSTRSIAQPSYAVRPTRPDGSRVAEPRAAYGRIVFGNQDESDDDT